MDGHFGPSGYAMYSQDGAHGAHQRQPQSNQQSQQDLASFGSLSSQAQHDSPAHTTLPPLQPTANGPYQFGNLSYQHQSAAGHSRHGSAPHTPITSSMPGNSSNAFASHVPPSNNQQQPSMMLPPSSFNQPSYGALSQSMMYPSSTSTSMPASNAPMGLPSLQPRPPGGIGNPMHGSSLLPGGAGHMGAQSAFMQNEEAPTHVVGSQGRRGILPSAPGRPNPPAQGAAQNTKSMIPQKDADGKFPCPHCNKTYLHAKHLKRHLLRHTGDRPYMCHLCKDTFSRSDILKRHFQKCSIRRGNPTGANHLAHQRRNNSNGGRMSISQQDGPIGLAGMPDVAGSGYQNGSANVNGDISGRSSRANTLTTTGTMSHRNSLAGLAMGGPNQPGGDQSASSAAAQPGMPAYAMPNSGGSGAPMHSNYAFNNQQVNGNAFSNSNNHDAQQMSFLGQQSSRFDNSRNSSPHHHQHPTSHGGEGNGQQFDWNRMFSQGGQDGFIGNQPANVSSQGIHNNNTDQNPNTNNSIKSDNSMKSEFGVQNNLNNESFLGSLYSHPGAWSEYGDHDQGILGFPNWSSDDPWQAKVDSLTHFCFPNGVMTTDPGAALVKQCMTVEMVKHLAEHYTSFHGHWPVIHMPTFKLTDATHGLAMAMISIGAIYSPRLTVYQSRQMMEFIRSVVLSNSFVYNQYLSGHREDLGSNRWHIDELQAVIILHCAFTWHGEPRHRQIARADYPTLCDLAKSMDLCRHAPQGHYAFSQLHSSSNSNFAAADAAGWNWLSWLEQEKRNRTMYLLFIIDAALSMVFNSDPQFDPFQIRLMLPADDAAWDAKDAQECAGALGLLGPEAQSRNITGDRRAKQPGMREALRTLMEPTTVFQPGATNAYAKFILVHALIVRVILCQRAAGQPGAHFQSYNLAFGSSNPATPLSQNDWLEQRSGSASLSNSGQGTPTMENGGAVGGDMTHHHMAVQQEFKRLGYALDKWKRTWDQDMDLQYPPGQTHLRRFGFSRDGVHFFYLARSFLQSRHPTDWTAPPDARFKHVMELLKRIKAFVISDNENKASSSSSGSAASASASASTSYGNGGFYNINNNLSHQQDIGSVADIDANYGSDDALALDMKQLFCPFDAATDSHVPGVQTYEL